MNFQAHSKNLRIDEEDTIRGDYLSPNELAELGAYIADEPTPTLIQFKPFVLMRRLRDNEKSILVAFQSTARAANVGETITPAAEWLLDNHYLVEENIRQVRRALPQKFYGELPELQLSSGEQVPRIIALSWLYTTHSHSSVSAKTLQAFIAGYQTRVDLKIGELWALPSVLRYVLIENLRRIADRLEHSRKMRMCADQLADTITSATAEGHKGPDLEPFVISALNDSFAAQLLYRLRDGSLAASQTLTWLEDQLELRKSNTEEVLVAEHNDLSSRSATIGNIMRSLRAIDDIDWAVWVEAVSPIDRVLAVDNGFQTLDFATRDSYRDRIEVLSRRSNFSETQVAQTAISMASETTAGCDVGHFLVGRLKSDLNAKLAYSPSYREWIFAASRRLNWLALALPVALGTIAAAIGGYFILSGSGIGWGLICALLLLFSIPAAEAATSFVHFFTSLALSPVRLPGFEWKAGVPREATTLVAVPCLITSRDEIDELVRSLEVHYLSNPKGAIFFALLSDWKDASSEFVSEDLTLLTYANAAIETLCQRYLQDGGRRFFLLHRNRLLNKADGVWMGWERKRGKLHELNQLLRGDNDTSFMQPAHAIPTGVKYVMTLDSDTRLTRDVVQKLVGKMHHPVNAPVVNATSGLVIDGHAIFQPRVTPSLTTGPNASVFQSIFSVDRGLDPYVFTVSDTYQDFLDEGSYTGKGLYQVDAFEAATDGRITDNAVLSHDLLEGSLARAALITDAEFVEDFPTRYEVEVSRQHRWTRGDWQLLPYIFGQASGVNGLGRYKMVDNLRRSLTPIFWMIASVTGWCVLSAQSAFYWQAYLVVSLFIAPSLSLITSILPERNDLVARAHFFALLTDFTKASGQVFLRITFIAHSAWMMADAIFRSLYRLYFSKRNLLEWKTASQVRDGTPWGMIAYGAFMWPSAFIGAVTIGVSVFYQSQAMFLVIPISMMWIVAPFVACFVSRSSETENTLQIETQDRKALRQIARRTWLYFETFVDAEHNFLPPDNVQEEPELHIAARTSPTNIGLYLLSVISARDLGWIGFDDAIDRIERTLGTIQKMEKCNGHLFNWYDTRNLQALEPRYVSTVDSGNLAGHLIAVSTTFRLWSEAPMVYRQSKIEGVIDVVGITKEFLSELSGEGRAVRPLKTKLGELLNGLLSISQSMLSEPEIANLRNNDLYTVAQSILQTADDLVAEFDNLESRELRVWCDLLLKTCQARQNDLRRESHMHNEFALRLSKMAEQARSLAFQMNFAFLYNQQRRLFCIGYRPETSELDAPCYDLLASEARLTSLFAIAKGDVPNEHWFRLGRPIVPVGSRGALLSWSGSMFEYLMPPLVMHERSGGILNQTNNLIVDRQIAYAKNLNIPWGISESAYNARDAHLTYQYSNFGIPSLGLKRGLAQDAVIAPYASLLASQYKPHAAVVNLQILAELGALGRYGFYDAVDFTPTRVPEGADFAIVRNFMAHHHGMSIVAVANAVLNGIMRDRFHMDSTIEAAELLLQEKAPREINVLSAKNDFAPRDVDAKNLRQSAVREIMDPIYADRETLLLSNGHYSVTMTATGAGGARWNGLAVTRWTPDPSEDNWGTFIFVRDMATNVWWSTTAAPRTAPAEKSCTLFSDDKAEFIKTVGTLRTEVQVIIGSESDSEGRCVTLINEGLTERVIELTSYSEIVLSNEDADNAHPLFSKMFVKTEFSAKENTIYAERNKRQPNEPNMSLAHMVVDSSGSDRTTQAETDRRRFLGRGRILSNAAAFDKDSVLSGSDGFTMDPVFSLRRVVRVPAGKKIKVIFWTIAAPNRAEVEQAVASCRNVDTFLHESRLAWTRSQVQLFHIGITSQQASTFQKIARYLVYPDTGLRQQEALVRRGLASQSALWPLSVSGDFPIFVLRIDNEADMPVVREALLMQEYLRSHNFVSDLVIVNEKSTSYAQDLQQAIESLAENARLRGHQTGPRDHIFTLRRDLMDKVAYDGLSAAAAVTLHTRNGEFSKQLGHIALLPMRPISRISKLPSTQTISGRNFLDHDREKSALVTDLAFWNGTGGFDKEGAYVVRLRAGETTPHPWINVISNGNFGFHVSCEGAGYTWSHNSRDYQLTPWTNDPVINRPGEAFYVVDRASGAVSSPFAGLSHDAAASFEVKHEPGASQFISSDDNLQLKLVQIVSPDQPMKLSKIDITNRSSKPVSLRLYAYSEWVLGNHPAKTRRTILSSWDEKRKALLVQNPFSVNFASRCAFVTSDIAPSSFTSDRRELLGHGVGDVFRPSSVYTGAKLSNLTSLTGDPCSALCFDLTIDAQSTQSVTIVLGDANSRPEALELVDTINPNTFDSAHSATTDLWSDVLQTLQVSTPDPAFNLMINRWLPYQNYACRIKARTAFYQSSGAFGFRDQLQDSLALLLQDPDIARSQILNAAGRQFPEGDVQHWWLPGSGEGVRTMISDDVVWLGYGVAHYVKVTGDQDVLDVELPFLEGRTLESGEHDAFFTPSVSEQAASVYEHCALALDLAIERIGPDGLSLILSGDWNDGMNRVGEAGRGESVWLSLFLVFTLEQFKPIAKSRGDLVRAKRWDLHIEALKVAIEGVGWDGGYYRRGSYDDGSPLGSQLSDECQIDALSQSWSVLAGTGTPERQEQAMDAVLTNLVDDENKIVRLFTPPFQNTDQEPGYIKGYPPGVRENGGQYTHGAIWVVYALAEAGRCDDAYRCFQMLNPINHALTPEAAEKYRVEPYAVAADIYGEGALTGRGGWTWYTGSAGWLFRAGVEGILGLKKEGGIMHISPKIPSDWDGYTATLKQNGKSYDIEILRNKSGSFKIKVNGNIIKASFKL